MIYLVKFLIVIWFFQIFSQTSMRKSYLSNLKQKQIIIFQIKHLEKGITIIKKQLKTPQNASILSIFSYMHLETTILALKNEIPSFSCKTGTISLLNFSLKK